MHKIHSKEFTLDDFGHEYLADGVFCEVVDEENDSGLMFNIRTEELLKKIIETLNMLRKVYLTTKNKKYWYNMIQILPNSYNQRATVQLNYEVLANIYHSRKNHKLDEWRIFCDWIRTLPYSELITGEGN